MTRPTLKLAKHPRGYEFWTTVWRDANGKQCRKNFGKLAEVTKKHATMRFQAWLDEEWVAKEHVRNPSGELATYTVTMLANAYEDEAGKIYMKNGKPTSHIFQIKLAMMALRDHYGDRAATAVGAPEIAKLRDAMIDSENQKGEAIKLTRKTVNGRLVIIKEAYRWAREHGLVTQEAMADVNLVRPLAHGRSEARNSRKVQPIPDATIDKTLPFCTKVLKAMIELQRHTGMRPGEIVAIKGEYIDKESYAPAWRYIVPIEVYKLAHIEGAREREVFIGPQGQAILAPFLDGRNPGAFIFSPQESENERARFKRRKPSAPAPATAATRGTQRARWKPGSHYTTASYRKAIEYAIKRAAREHVDIDHWHPNQIRHTRGTEVRRQHGIDAASVVLGHTNIKTTEIYAEQDRQKAAQIATQSG